MTQTVYGTKYEATKGLSTTEIAKRVRDDIKALIKDGTLPKGIKTSVKTKYFSGGSSLDVTITALPEEIPLHNPAYLLADAKGENTYALGLPRQSVQVRSYIAAIEKAVEAYNYDGSDSQTDYFHVRFYSSVKLDWSLDTAARSLGELAAAKRVEAEKEELRQLEAQRQAEEQRLHDRAIARAAAVEAFCNSLTSLVRHCEDLANFEPDLSGLTRTTRYLPTAGHYPSNVHGYAESLTIGTFKANGLDHIARRFWRADVPNTGKIELYLVEPGTEHEDFFRYVNEFEPSRVDIQAIAAIKDADPTYTTPTSFDFVQRVSNLELV